MKFWLKIIAFIVIVTGSLVNAETVIEKSGSSQSVIVNQGNRETHKQKTEKQEKSSVNKQRNSNWPSTFIPSEKIKADSSVPFPVDI